MTYHITTIQPNGDTVHSASDSVPELDQLKEGLEQGALIELVPHFDKYGARDCVVFCDEEGKLKSLEPNPRATYLWFACLAPDSFIPDTLCGPVVIVHVDDKKLLREL